MKAEGLKIDYTALEKISADVLHQSIKGIWKEYWEYQRQWHRSYLPEGLRSKARQNMKRLSRIKAELQLLLDMKYKVAA